MTVPASMSIDNVADVERKLSYPVIWTSCSTRPQYLDTGLVGRDIKRLPKWARGDFQDNTVYVLRFHDQTWYPAPV